MKTQKIKFVFLGGIEKVVTVELSWLEEVTEGLAEEGLRGLVSLSNLGLIDYSDMDNPKPIAFRLENLLYIEVLETSQEEAESTKVYGFSNV